MATTPITVSGVGNGINSANVIVKFPGAIIDSDSNAHEITFEAPVIPGADIPALWGNASLTTRNSFCVGMVR